MSTRHQRILVAGGAGFIGTHVCVELLAAGREILVVDDFSNASPLAPERVAAIAGRRFEVLHADLADPSDRARVIAAAQRFRPDAAVHLAGLKAVGESVAQPIRYYRVNVGATWTLLDALQSAGARTIVFSSSATVYSGANASPVDEAGELGPSNPYGRTKLHIEQMLKDVAAADPDWRVCNLRYFNPVGAHPSGFIGEDPMGPPNNLFPFIAQVAVGRRSVLNVFGGDYPTRDGTGVRDYIHVMDLALGHLAALDYLERAPKGGALDVNLGAGRGITVLEAVRAFEAASGRRIPFEIVGRRPGDVAALYANADRAAALFDWRTTRSLEDMCADHWRWQERNPHGFAAP